MSRFLDPECQEADSAANNGDPFPVSDWDDWRMEHFPRLDFSNRDVRRAGEVLAGPLIWSEQTASEIREAFHIANNWRDAHAFPMRSIRYQMRGLMRYHNIDGICAARLKRMQAIRRKLQRTDFPMNLTQIQDLGGCRAILPTMAHVRKLVGLLRDRSRHELWKEDHYIDEPKPDGYRSHHLRYKFRAKGPEKIHEGRRIEIQVRTELQHSWATAVEAVGLLRREGLKNHEGSPEWLRLFALMSAEFAEAEGCATPPDIPSHAARVKEIAELDRTLRAYDALEQVGYAVWWSQDALFLGDRPRYYLIKFDNVTRRATVEPHYQPIQATLSYDVAERPDNESGNDTTNVVLVEADKVQSLTQAYPNYFGDVQLFKRTLYAITNGEDPQDYMVQPQERVAKPKIQENPIWGWWFNKPNRRWTEKK